MDQHSTAAHVAGTEDLAIIGLSKSFGATPVLQDLDLTIRKGEFLTILGPSGSGKTTLLLVLAGFVYPDRGSIRLGGTELLSLQPHKRDIGLVFQNYALFPHMDVFANVAFPLKLRGVSREDIARRVADALALVRLAGFGDRRVDQLSGGQKQRVALARAIVFGPPILLMDEPLSALDKKLRDSMQIEIRHLHETLGATTIYVTHDQREAITMSDRVAVLDGGKLVQIDTPQGLYDNPCNRFIADFIGESSFLPVMLRSGCAEIAGRTIRAATVIERPGAPHFLVLRPERLRVGESNESPEFNVFAGRVRERIYQGDSFVLHVDLDDGAGVTVRTPVRSNASAQAFAPGDTIRLVLDPRDAVVVPDDRSGAPPAS
jgi:putative spermidine/putrescine transport system ATP-binding protein